MSHKSIQWIGFKNNHKTNKIIIKLSIYYYYYYVFLFMFYVSLFNIYFYRRTIEIFLVEMP